MQGKIIRGIAGFYYVHVQNMGVIECKAKGIFRNKKVKPLVGDNVKLEIIDEKAGNIIEILPRKNSIIRPAVANVDQAVVIFAASYPKPNLNLLDRFLLIMQTQNVQTVICINKIDDSDYYEIEKIADNYAKSGCDVYKTSTVTGEGIKEFGKCLKGKTSVLAGPSGVGKSSVIYCLFPAAAMATGEISDKIKRGKHTTRHSELFCLAEDVYLMDTPGFTSLSLPDIEKEELKDFYPEFDEYRGQCRFLGCVHISEPDCAVKHALESEKISSGRYDNYRQFYEEISNRKKY